MKELTTRQIHTFEELGKRTLKDLLVSQFAVMTISPPEEIWLVSPWIRDFPILDDPSKPFRFIGWDKPIMQFSDLIACAVNNGARLNLVVRNDDKNETFLSRLADSIIESRDCRFGYSNTLHLKGLLTQTIYLKGSMNFTYAGTDVNDEGVSYETSPEIVSYSRQQFRSHYKDILGSWEDWSHE